MNDLLKRVHERTGLGVDIMTWTDGTVEIRWKRDYGEEGWSDERWLQAGSIEAGLQGVIDHEDAADREESNQDKEPNKGARRSRLAARRDRGGKPMIERLLYLWNNEDNELILRWRIWKMRWFPYRTAEFIGWDDEKDKIKLGPWKWHRPDALRRRSS